MRPILRSALAAALFALFAVPPGGAIAQDNWRHAAHYPARIQATVFGNWRMNATNGVTWGSWTARFGSKSLLATYVPPSSPHAIACFNVVVKDIICRNAVVGEQPCWLQLTASCIDTNAERKRRVESTCSLNLGAHPKITEFFLIDCPHQLVFDR